MQITILFKHLKNLPLIAFLLCNIHVPAQSIDSLKKVFNTISEEQRLILLSNLTMLFQERNIPKAPSYVWGQKQLVISENVEGMGVEKTLKTEQK